MDEPIKNITSPTDNVSQKAATNLQAIIDEERAKRVEAENFAKALVEEFTTCGDFEDVRTKFRDKIREFAPAALINIMNLANNAESESVRANLNKWVLDWAMSDKIDGTNSEISDLIKKLREQPSSTTPESATQTN